MALAGIYYRIQSKVSATAALDAQANDGARQDAQKAERLLLSRHKTRKAQQAAGVQVMRPRESPYFDYCDNFDGQMGCQRNGD